MDLFAISTLRVFCYNGKEIPVILTESLHEHRDLLPRLNSDLWSNLT